MQDRRMQHTTFAGYGLINPGGHLSTRFKDDCETVAFVGKEVGVTCTMQTGHFLLFSESILPRYVRGIE